jgi:uncharacterized protein (DUF433 family)
MTHRTERRTGRNAVITVKEAAFAAGVSVKAVNQAIDREQIQTRPLRRATDGARRGIGPGEAVFLTVSQVLAPEVRRKVYRSFRGRDLPELPRRLDMGGVVLELEGVIQSVEERLSLLSSMRERVEVDPEIRGGEPVFRGTRIPIHGIARKRALGSTNEELLEDYPKLTEDDLELATGYAELYPRRGRPRTEGTRRSRNTGAA